MNDIRTLHPAMGWVSVRVSEVDGLIKQTATDHEIQKAKDRMEQEAVGGMLLNLMTGEQKPVSLREALLGDRQVTEDEVRQALEDAFQPIEAGVVLEVGPLPPGYPEPGFTPGCKVFFSSGVGVDLPGVKMFMIDKVFAWTDE